MKSPEQLKGAIRKMAKEKEIGAGSLLQMFLFERILERLAHSKYRDAFILKGGLLIASMIGVNQRTTMDMDTTIRGLPVNEELLTKILTEILRFESDDDIVFSLQGLKSIRVKSQYEDYCANETELASYSVYISLQLPYAYNMMKPNLFTSSIAENRAIIYWREHPAKVSERIAIIGNDSLTDNMLTRGLLFNLISPKQEISYHIWKKDNTYQYLHPQLKQVTMDHIFFYEEPYYKHLDILQNMDRVILCGSDKENLDMLINLKTYFVKPNIHIAYSRKESIQAFYKEDTIVTFGTFQELFTREVIIKESLLERAKTLHNEYFEKNDGDEWEALDVFKRQSNINSAEYMEQIRNLHKNGVDSEVLAELTHICWNRLHILNNWCYGDVRNDAQRIHNLIKSYTDLSEEEKQKDRDIVYSVTKG